MIEAIAVRCQGPTSQKGQADDAPSALASLLGIKDRRSALPKCRRIFGG